MGSAGTGWEVGLVVGTVRKASPSVKFCTNDSLIIDYDP